MTPGPVIQNLPASLWQRLRNLAHRRGLAANSLVERYTNERMLYRLSASEEVDRFTLKGAALFRVWDQEDLRPTRDVDLLAGEPANAESIRESLEAICALPCPADGVVFDPATIRTQGKTSRCSVWARRSPEEIDADTHRAGERDRRQARGSVALISRNGAGRSREASPLTIAAPAEEEARLRDGREVASEPLGTMAQRASLGRWPVGNVYRYA